MHGSANLFLRPSTQNAVLYMKLLSWGYFSSSDLDETYYIQGVPSKFEQLRLNITFFVIARFSKN
jgi:hypothetical protein